MSLPGHITEGAWVKTMQRAKRHYGSLAVDAIHARLRAGILEALRSILSDDDIHEMTETLDETTTEELAAIEDTRNRIAQLDLTIGRGGMAPDAMEARAEEVAALTLREDSAERLSSQLALLQDILIEDHKKSQAEPEKAASPPPKPMPKPPKKIDPQPEPELEPMPEPEPTKPLLLPLSHDSKVQEQEVIMAEAPRTS